MRIVVAAVSGFVFLSAVAGCSAPQSPRSAFTVVVIPDTQNMTDFRRQTSQGYAIDGSEMYLEEMRDIAAKAVSNGGDVVFVTSVGDVWQNIVSDDDPEHVARGIVPLRGVDEDFEAEIAAMIRPEQVLGFEIPTAIEGYRFLEQAGIPFGVVPGNHDYDAWWTVGVEQASGPLDLEYHIGGLSNFRSAFGGDSPFFRDKDWYVGAYEAGGSSAQIFSGGAYRFLHISLEMQAGDDVVAWARSIIDDHPGLPTIVSTHDYLNPRGERLPGPNMDLALTDPDGNNSAEELWQTFISDVDQIFMVLCGHQLGQAVRIDRNDYGHEVYQILADFQGRGRVASAAGQTTRSTTGDGWYREMTFYLDDARPRVEVRTYSSYYDSYSGDLATYAEWYKPVEQPDMTDEEFLAADEFTIELGDFRDRFAPIDD